MSIITEFSDKMSKAWNDDPQFVGQVIMNGITVCLIVLVFILKLWEKQYLAKKEIEEREENERKRIELEDFAKEMATIQKIDFNSALEKAKIFRERGVWYFT